jgi:uncharacterized protein (DUF3820 family)
MANYDYIGLFNLEEVAEWKINFGKYKGETYGEIRKKDSAYLIYLYEKGAFDNEQYEKTNRRIRRYINMFS